MHCLTRLSLAVCCFVGVGSAFAQKPESKGHAQISGAYGRFGETYTMSRGLNLTIYSVKCQITPHAAYGNNGLIAPGPEEKLVVIEFGVKNSNNEDTEFGDGGGYFSAVDAAGEKYDSNGLAFQSTGSAGQFITLKPGQGAGTPELKDPLRMVFVVPMKVVINKIMVKEGRKGKNEETLRFLVAGSDAQADPKNVIKPLPDSIRDTQNKAGMVGLSVGNASPTAVFFTGVYGFQFLGSEKVEGSKFAGEDIEDGKMIWVAKVAIQSLGDKVTLFDALSDEITLVDGDGEKVHPKGFYKPKADEAVDSAREMSKGEPYTVRVAFELPKSSVPKSLLLSANKGLRWKVALDK